MSQISVIIPVYNKIKYINDILSDLRAQTFTDFECILIDDGSTDGSGEACDEFAKTDDRFIVRRIPNGGVSHARNIGLDIAQGEFVTFIDSDDRIKEGYLQNLYDCINLPDAEFVIADLTKYWSDGREEKMRPLPYRGAVSMEAQLPEFVKNQKSQGFYGFCVAKIFRRSLTNGIRFDESIRLAEDFDYYLRLYSKVNTIIFSDNYDYLYLQEAANSSFGINDYKIDYHTQLKIQLRFRDFLIGKNAFSGENEELLGEIIENYIFCTLFYADLSKFDDIYAALRQTVNDNSVGPRIIAEGRRKRILGWFWNDRPSYIKIYLKCFRTARALFGRK